MSDPEDVQDSAFEMTGDFVYQLRRIGPPATLPKVPDTMVLKMGLTKIGRGQHNDFYIDSATLKNFISRSHVEIYGKKNENGKVEFVLNDKGLNGTFINDIRTHKTCVLEEGCKITFGHTNGYKIERGTYAEQPYSEFQFTFEKIPRTSKPSERISSEIPTAIRAEADSSSQNVDHKKDIVPDRSFLGDIQSNLQSVQSVEKISTKHKTSSQRGRSRRDSDSLDSDSEPVESSHRNSTVSQASVKSSDKSSAEDRIKPQTKKSVDKNTKSAAKRKTVSDDVESDSDSDSDDSDDSDDDDDDDDNEESENKVEKEEKKEEKEEEKEEEEDEEEEEEVSKVIPRNSRSANQSKQVPTVSNKRKCREELENTVEGGKSDDSDEEDSEEDDESEEEEEEEKVPVKKNVPKRKFPPKRKPVPQSRGRAAAAAAAAAKSKKAKPPPPPSSESEESSDDEASKPEADRRNSPAQPVKRPPPPRKKKSPAGNSAPAVGSRKRRRRTPAAPAPSTAPTGADLEPGVEWYDDETCESADCKRPKKKRTPWVQCDDCDAWYHTVCVGANYNALLKDSDAHFNCGCVKSD